MSTQVSNAGHRKFRLAIGLNRGGGDLDKAFDIYLVSNRLRLGIHKFDLSGEKYEILVAELQIFWGGALGLFKGKAFGEGVEEDDSSQTRVVAEQVRKVVDAYFERNPRAASDASTKRRHIYFASVFVLEAIYEVQMGHERVFAKYLLSDSVERVTVEGKYSKRSNESPHEFQVRQLEERLAKQYAENKKQYLENRDLKFQVEANDDLHLQLQASKRDEELALDQRDMYKGKLKGLRAKKDQLERKNGQLERQVTRLERKAADAEAGKKVAEQKVEELLKQLKSLKAS